jgi:hypothetical protein
MGQEIEKTFFSKEDYDQFRYYLEKETSQLEALFNDGVVTNDALMGGFEIESWLLNESLQPAPLNKEFIDRFDSSLATPELAQFNLEFNNMPRELTATALGDFHKELLDTWGQAVNAAHDLSLPSSLLLIGTLPTLNLSDLNEHSMSDMNRYRALNSEIMDRRKKKPVHLYIQGHELLDLYSHDVMLEASTTSFQIHTKVPALDAHHYYNASIMVSASLVAISSNSPYVFGKNLWSETRIPLFEQSIDTDNPDAPCKRVSFGSGFAQESILECFQENMKEFHILLPIIEENNHNFSHLRLHNGTIWRWNRPLLGFDSTGEPHFRIEHRAIAAGPTFIDMMANAAFYFGLQHYWAQHFKQGHDLPAFEETKNNFYLAAKHGLQDYIMHWFGKEANPAELIRDKLLNQAKLGLQDLQICAADIKEYLDIIAARTDTQQTGASWQRKYVATHGCDMTELTHAYHTLQQTGEPIHTWEVKRNFFTTRKISSHIELKQLDSFPKELLDISVENLYTLFPEPALLHLHGIRPETIFISVLLHGNEGTGFHVIQNLLRKYENTRLPRSISIFFGNTQAAQHGVRFLDHQPDFNRVWPGTNHNDSQEAKVMQEIVDEMQSRNLFASIDIHNNTGLNPHYACINKLENKFLRLASLFGPTVVYFLTPKGVQSMAFSELCPAVTLECGKVDSESGVAHALEFLDAVLHMKEISNEPLAPQDIHLFHTIARVKVPQDVSFSFTDSSADILFTQALDKMNFSEMPAKTCFGKVHANRDARLEAFDDNDEEIGKRIFQTKDHKIQLIQTMMPAMLTLDEMVIRQDCLCYLMERIPHPK